MHAIPLTLTHSLNSTPNANNSYIICSTNEHLHQKLKTWKKEEEEKTKSCDLWCATRIVSRYGRSMVFAHLTKHICINNLTTLLWHLHKSRRILLNSWVCFFASMYSEKNTHILRCRAAMAAKFGVKVPQYYQQRLRSALLSKSDVIFAMRNANAELYARGGHPPLLLEFKAPHKQQQQHNATFCKIKICIYFYAISVQSWWRTKPTRKSYLIINS